MSYRQLTSEERHMLAALRRQGCNQSQIDRAIGRHRSPVCRELRRMGGRPKLMSGCAFRARLLKIEKGAPRNYRASDAPHTQFLQYPHGCDIRLVNVCPDPRDAETLGGVSQHSAGCLCRVAPPPEIGMDAVEEIG